MNKTWLIIRHEYLKNVRTRRFLVALVTMPTIILLSLGVGLAAARMQMDSRPFGYVDGSGFLPREGISELPHDFLEPALPGLAYPSIESARVDLESGKIQGIFNVLSDFEKTGNAELIVLEKAGANLVGQFSNYLRDQFKARLPEKNAFRISEGTKFVLRSADGSREIDSSNWITYTFPILSAVLFIIVISTSGGYLLLAMIDEKENRTMEILATSASPNQLLTGKIIGNLMVGLTQLFVWVAFALAAVFIANQAWGVGSGAGFSAQQIAIIVTVMFPAFVLVAALMTALGASVTEQREAQQVSALFTLPMVSPLWFMQYLIEHPNSNISVFLSVFPLTAPVSLPIRASVTNISWLDIGVAAAIMCISAVLALWVAAQTFRLGMLRYGKRVNVMEIAQSLLSRKSNA